MRDAGAGKARMKIELFHSAYEDLPVRVATFEVPEGPVARSLARVYLSTQNQDSSWVAKAAREFPSIRFDAAVSRLGGFRSTCEGDFALVAGEKWVYTRSGWIKETFLAAKAA